MAPLSCSCPLVSPISQDARDLFDSKAGGVRDTLLAHPSRREPADGLSLWITDEGVWK